MAQSLQAFKETIQRAERRSAASEQLRGDETQSREVRSAVAAGNDRYQGYIATINGMRDRDIERALTGR